MGCSPVRGDNSRALANGLSNVQVDKLPVFYTRTTYLSVDIMIYFVLQLVRVV